MQEKKSGEIVVQQLASRSSGGLLLLLLPLLLGVHLFFGVGSVSVCALPVIQTGVDAAGNERLDGLAGVYFDSATVQLSSDAGQSLLNVFANLKAELQERDELLSVMELFNRAHFARSLSGSVAALYDLQSQNADETATGTGNNSALCFLSILVQNQTGSASDSFELYSVDGSALSSLSGSQQLQLNAMQKPAGWPPSTATSSLFRTVRASWVPLAQLPVGAGLGAAVSAGAQWLLQLWSSDQQTGGMLLDNSSWIWSSGSPLQLLPLQLAPGGAGANFPRGSLFNWTGAGTSSRLGFQLADACWVSASQQFFLAGQDANGTRTLSWQSPSWQLSSSWTGSGGNGNGTGATLAVRLLQRTQGGGPTGQWLAELRAGAQPRNASLQLYQWQGSGPLAWPLKQQLLLQPWNLAAISGSQPPSWGDISFLEMPELDPSSGTGQAMLVTGCDQLGYLSVFLWQASTGQWSQLTSTGSGGGGLFQPPLPTTTTVGSLSSVQLFSAGPDRLHTTLALSWSTGAATSSPGSLQTMLYRWNNWLKQFVLLSQSNNCALWRPVPLRSSPFAQLSPGNLLQYSACLSGTLGNYSLNLYDLDQ